MNLLKLGKANSVPHRELDFFAYIAAMKRVGLFMLIVSVMLVVAIAAAIFFADSKSGKEMLSEREFVEFLHSLSGQRIGEAQLSIKTLMQRESVDSLSLQNAMELTEKYLYNPNSPLRNEELYIAVLQYVVESPKLDELAKLRSRYQLDLAQKNRVGTTAADFEITLRDGSKKNLLHLLHAFRVDNFQYAILLFNNPDCADCERVKLIIESNRALIESAGAKILAIYTDENLDAWRAENYPKWWINGHDKEVRINREQLYDLKAIPTVYLLDKDGRVLLKDAPIERIIHYLGSKRSA